MIEQGGTSYCEAETGQKLAHQQFISKIQFWTPEVPPRRLLLHSSEQLRASKQIVLRKGLRITYCRLKQHMGP